MSSYIMVLLDESSSKNKLGFTSLPQLTQEKMANAADSGNVVVQAGELSKEGDSKLKVAEEAASPPRTQECQKI